MTRCKATLAYDGSAYQGFQRQAEGIATIQGCVERAIISVTGQSVTVIGAGRTDTGVHAQGQVIIFDCDWKHTEADLLRAINANLPDDVALQDIERHAGFHPRFDAKARIYAYTVAPVTQRQPLLVRQSWQVQGPINLEAMQQAAAMLIGEHDFATFGTPPQGTNTTRTVFRSEWRARESAFGPLLVYEIEATAFLYHMVRRIVAMLVQVGMGRKDLKEFEQAFRSRDISFAKMLAPPEGLVLLGVRYED